MKFSALLTKWILALAVVVAAAGCSNDDTDKPNDGYGFIQLRLYKSGSYATRALDYLNEAAKIKLTFRSSDNTLISQTVNVSAANKELAEYGMQTDKFQLIVDEYTIVNFQVYDVLDQPILSGEPTEGHSQIKVIAGGLVTQDVAVDVVERGQIKFQLVKDLSGVETRAVGDKYPFHSIMFVDVTVRNRANTAFRFEGIKMTHKVFHPEDDPDYYTSICETDSLVYIPAGTYRVTEFTTYYDRNKSSTIAEHSGTVPTNEFTVHDNQVTTADVPVTLTESSGAIKDAVTLRKIWLALDGPNWKKGKIWDFDRDVDLWTAQDGVEIVESGRIAVLNFENSQAKGAMPKEIGDLAELRALYMGTHTYEGGASIVNPEPSRASAKMYELLDYDARQAERRSFTETFSAHADPRHKLSKELQLSFELNNDPLIGKSELRTLPAKNNPVNYSNLISSLPQEITKLTKLATLYIAFSPIKELPEDLSKMTGLTDVEIYNCPDMTKFPAGLATLPKLTALVFSCNYNVPADEMYLGLQALNSKAARRSLQMLDMPGQPLEAVPDLSGIRYLGQLNIQNCGVKKFDVPFGKSVSLGKLIASYNELEELPRDENGYFIGEADVESYDFSNNKFKVFPDMFDMTTKWQLGPIDFSFNEIEDIEIWGGGDTPRGLNTTNLSLAYNKLTKFPGGLIRANSEISILQLQGNQIDTFEKEDLEGKNIKAMSTLDLSFNKLKKLPENFYNATFPYMTGLDLSYNRFTSYPWSAMSLANLAVFIFRHQRDENGERTMREWPTGIYQHNALRALYLGSNDIRKVSDNNLSYRIYNLEIADNPNISIDVSSICYYITNNMFFLYYDPDQDIRGCDALRLNQ